MRTVELSAGPLDYQDRGDGAPVVLLHGAHMNAALWDAVVAEFTVAQILVTKQPRRIAWLVLASCEAFDSIPPGLPGQTSRLAGLLPGDTRRFIEALDAAELTAAADRLDSVDRPALVVWASEDRVMPLEHAERLATLLNAGPVQWIDSSYTLLPLDQPTEFAHAISTLARRPA